MLFHSVGFLFIFLPFFLICTSLAPKGTARTLLLLVFSYFFYSGGEPIFVLILLTSSLVDYTAALKINAHTRKTVRRAWLLISISINLGLLCFFKYGGWAAPTLTPVLSLFGLQPISENFFLGFYLPPGISFYTFQSMSYSIDVYRKEISPERNLISFCNYVGYLPQLIAGPIERYSHLAPQIASFASRKSRPQWSAGLDRICLGLIQKLFIADSCGLIVDRLSSYNGSYDFILGWSLAISFGMQIYFDFAAYSHMAIGISLILGIKLSENFNSPYQAATIQDFWRRWHMTLSSWFRDYLYIPLGGSRCSLTRTTLNILLTFILIGLWHGAGSGFIIWGFAHGVLLALYRVKQAFFTRVTIYPPLAILITFLCVQFLWVPFRINDFSQFMAIWKSMIGLNGITFGQLSTPDILFITFVSLGTFFIPNAGKRWPGGSGWLESTVIVSLAVVAIFTSIEISQFIYFQF